MCGSMFELFCKHMVEPHIKTCQVKIRKMLVKIHTGACIMLAELTVTHLIATTFAGDLQVSGFRGCKHNVLYRVVMRSAVLLKGMMLQKHFLNLSLELIWKERCWITTRRSELSSWLSAGERQAFSHVFLDVLDTSTFCLVPDLLLPLVCGGSWRMALVSLW